MINSDGKPDLEAARRYALDRLEREIPPTIFYHTVAHTRDEVEPAATRLAQMENLSEVDMLLVRTAALYHDVGYIERIQGHEAVSIRIAEEVLPGFGYTPEQVKVIRGMIEATKIPQLPRTLLEKILVDADLDVLGTENFLPRCWELQAELAAEGQRLSEVEWLQQQKSFLLKHRYRTVSARKLRDAQKRLNIKQIDCLLQNCREAHPG